MDKKQNRWWDVPAAICWMAIAIIAASRLEATNWAENLDLATTAAVLGGILGLAIGKSRFSRRTAAWLAVIYSILVVPWILGTIVGEGVLWLERFASLGARLSLTLSQLIYNQPIRDPLLLIVIMVLAFWLLSLIGGYRLVRYGRPWVPLILIALILMLIEFFSATLIRSAWYSAGFAFVVVCLIAQLYFRQSYRQWEEQSVLIDSDTEFFRGRAALITVSVLVVVAWLLPFTLRALVPGSIAQQEVRDKWTGLQERLNNVFGSFQGPARVEVWTFGEVMTLSTGQPSSDLPLFRVETPIETLKGTTYYWRARSYDSYRDNHWQNTITNRLDVIPNVNTVVLPPWAPRLEGEFAFEAQTNLLVLYSPGMATTISRPVEVVARELDDGSLDFVAMQANPMVRAGDRYTVTASLGSPTIAQLRVAGDEYPDWVTQKYLQIPSDLPQSILDLSAEITASYDTPYEKTVAITNYLRRTIKYSETIPEPPKNADPLEWFLLEYKQGFCQYYATAEVMLLRAAGVPARLVVGYAPGDLQGDERTFQVRAKHSHAWPEVYFPNIGWVEFEPTSGLNPIARPLGDVADLYPGDGGGLDDDMPIPDDEELPDDNPNPQPDDAAAGPGGASAYQYNQPLLIAAGQFGLVSEALLALVLIYQRMIHKLIRWQPLPIIVEALFRRLGLKRPAWLNRLAEEARLSPIERYFRRIGWALRRLKHPGAPSLTPAEQVAALNKIYPQGAEPARILLDEYERAVYSPYQPDLARAQQAQTDLRQMVIRSWWENLLTDSREPVD